MALKFVIAKLNDFLTCYFIFRYLKAAGKEQNITASNYTKEHLYQDCYSWDIGNKQSTLSPSTLTGHIEVDEHLVPAHFVLRRALVHDRNGGVANVKPTHYL